MALKKTTKTTTTSAKKGATYGRLGTASTQRPASGNFSRGASRTNNSNSNTGSKFTRVTGLFNTKTEGNLIGTTLKEVQLPNGGVIPEGTTFLVMESKPYEGREPSYPYSLVIPPPRD